MCSADVFEISSRGWNPVTVCFHSESVSLLQLHKTGFFPGRLVQLACGGFALSSHRGWNKRLLLGCLAFIAGYCIVYPTPLPKCECAVHDSCHSLMTDSETLSRQQKILSLSSLTLKSGSRVGVRNYWYSIIGMRPASPSTANGSG